MRSVVFVASTDTPDGERFWVVQPEALPGARRGTFASPSDAMSAWSRLNPEERRQSLQEAWQRYLQSVTLLTEPDIRRLLTEEGLSADAVDAHVEHARTARVNTMRWIAAGESFVWETTTAVGYRNPDGQAVVRRTELPGTRLYQRIVALQCEHCGHEYGADGCDVHNRRCPNCQGGPPGLPTSNVLE